MLTDPRQLQKDDRFAAAQGEVPLCVDLDGTLVKSDTLVDAVLLLVRQQPASPLQWPGWLAKGKAGFKREVTSRAVVDVEHLPYNRRLLEYLREEHARGRRIYLATAADAGRVPDSGMETHAAGASWACASASAAWGPSETNAASSAYTVRGRYR